MQRKKKKSYEGESNEIIIINKKKHVKDNKFKVEAYFRSRAIIKITICRCSNNCPELRTTFFLSGNESHVKPSKAL